MQHPQAHRTDAEGSRALREIGPSADVASRRAPSDQCRDAAARIRLPIGKTALTLPVFSPLV